MQRYGLQIRTKPPSSSSSRAPPPPARPLAAFADDDDDDVEKEILRQAAKKRALQKVTCSTHRLARTLLHRFHANTLDNYFLSSPFVRMVLLRAHR